MICRRPSRRRDQQSEGREISPNTWDVVINTIALAGIACLAVPAWHANRYGRLIARLATGGAPFKDPHVLNARKRVLEDLRTLQGEWKRWKANLLIAGTGLSALASILGIVKPICLWRLGH
jgi:hypothetical protein